jgi:hypothetical protein
MISRETLSTAVNLESLPPKLRLPCSAQELLHSIAEIETLLCEVQRETLHPKLDFIVPHLERELAKRRGLLGALSEPPRPRR